VEIKPLAIEGLWEITPLLRPDDRGVFLEAYKSDLLSEAIGHPFTLRQMNISVSSAGTVRGIHFADVPVGQAKYVQCMAGSILDVVVDIRVGSPTFGQWDAIELNSTSRKALYISEGLGHAFCALADDATVGYLCSEPYSPTHEHGIHPMDSDLALPWPEGTAALLSPKDAGAPTLASALESGLLPSYDECVAFRRSLAH
jgi:dTDP-4-dehydrorhamnose 3,5-epimerase